MTDLVCAQDFQVALQIAAGRPLVMGCHLRGQCETICRNRRGRWWEPADAVGRWVCGVCASV